MSNYGKKSSAKSSKELDEVEELLRATEDEMILNLRVDSHASRTSSSSPLDQDLIRRFEALKAPSTAKKITNVPPGPRVLKKEKKKDGDDGRSVKIVEDDDPFARFSALKSTGNKSSTSSSVAAMESQLKSDGNRSENEEDEVSKLIQWAMDAARLDPSISSSEEDSDDLDDDTDDDDDDDERKKKKNKKKPAK